MIIINIIRDSYIKKIIEFTIIFLISSFLLILISNCRSINRQIGKHLSRDQIKVTVGSAYGWFDLMPGSGRRCIVIPVILENNTSIDINNLYIHKAEIIKNKKVIGFFRPSFQVFYDCKGGKLAHSSGWNEINLLSGCKLKFNLRDDGFMHNIPYDIRQLQGTKVRFRFVNNIYFTDVYETNRMGWGVVH